MRKSVVLLSTFTGVIVLVLFLVLMSFSNPTQTAEISLSESSQSGQERRSG